MFACALLMSKYKAGGFVSSTFISINRYGSLCSLLKGIESA